MVFIYEYLITISEEAKYFWKRKLTGASAVFLLNRYVPLTLHVLELASFASLSDQVCYFKANNHISCMTLIPLVRGLQYHNRYDVAYYIADQ